jgi:hypothetical protein
MDEQPDYINDWDSHIDYTEAPLILNPYMGLDEEEFERLYQNHQCGNSEIGCDICIAYDKYLREDKDLV